jgi:hypothetical protein
MYRKIAEIVGEYVLFVEGLSFSVKGRITKSTNQEGSEEFRWEISHHYRPSESAGGVYYPSVRESKSFDEVRQLLMAYMNCFTTIDVTPNEHY